MEISFPKELNSLKMNKMEFLFPSLRFFMYNQPRSHAGLPPTNQPQSIPTTPLPSHVFPYRLVETQEEKTKEMWSSYAVQNHLGPRNLQDPLGSPSPHIPQGGLWNLGCPEKIK